MYTHITKVPCCNLGAGHSWPAGSACSAKGVESH